MMKFDYVSLVLARAASLALFAIGGILAFEVIARYFFNAPTIWAEELSRLLFIWAVYISAAHLLHTGDHIRVTVLTDSLSEKWQARTMFFSHLMVGAVSAYTVSNILPALLRSIEKSSSSGTMLDVPSWLFLLPLLIGFTMLALQAVVEAIRIYTNDPLSAPNTQEETPK